jgi:drug/metabolite transporter (DMT)-like permease
MAYFCKSGDSRRAPLLVHEIVGAMHSVLHRGSVSRLWLGLALILVSAACFGATPIFARLAYAAGTDTYTLLALRFGIAAVCLGAFQTIRGAALPRGKLLVGLALLGAVGRAGQALTYFVALIRIPAALVSLLLYLYPAIVTLLAVLFLHERLTWLKLGAIAVALAGTALTIGPSAGGTPVGVALGIATACIYAVYIVVSSRVTPQAGVLASSTVITAAAALVYCTLAALHGPSFPTTLLGWAAVLGLALLSTVVGTVTFFAGLQRVGPTDASTLSTLEPAVTVVLAALILGETIAPIQLLGGALILTAVVVLARSKG